MLQWLPGSKVLTAPVLFGGGILDRNGLVSGFAASIPPADSQQYASEVFLIKGDGPGEVEILPR